MSQHTFYSGLDIHAAEAIDKRFYIDSLTTPELKRVFGSDGRYGFDKSFVFNKSINKFQYLSTYLAKSDVIEVSNWLTIESDGSSFTQYNPISSYTIGNSIWFEDSSNSTGFYIALGIVNSNESPESHPNKWLKINSGSGSGGTVISGTSKKLSKFNPTGDNVIDSSITDDTNNVLIEKPVLIDSLVQNESGLSFKNLKSDIGLLEPTQNNVLVGTDVRAMIEKNGVKYIISRQSNTLVMISNNIITTTVSFAEPPADIVFATDGNLYVVCNDYAGTIYKVTTSGIKTLLCTTGRIYPNKIIQGVNGKLYIICSYNTDFASGAMVQIELNGTYSSFSQVDGVQILKIVQKTNNNNFYILGGNGTVYEIPQSGGVATPYFVNPSTSIYILMLSTVNDLYVIVNSTGIYKINSGGSTLIKSIDFGVNRGKIISDIIYFNDSIGNFYRCTLSGVLSNIGQDDVIAKTDDFLVLDNASKFYFAAYDDTFLREFSPAENTDLISVNKDGKVVKSTSPVIKALKINKTKDQVDTLINSSSLIPGALYEISGVDSNLYDDGNGAGTTILLHALSNNTLSKNGHGIFWNPKYDKNIDGFGIYGSKQVLNGYFERTNIINKNLPTTQKVLKISQNYIAFKNDLYKYSVNTNEKPLFTYIDSITTVLNAEYDILDDVSNSSVYVIKPDVNSKIVKYDSSGNLSNFLTLNGRFNKIVGNSSSDFYVYNSNNESPNIYHISGSVQTLFAETTDVKFLILVANSLYACNSTGTVIKYNTLDGSSEIFCIFDGDSCTDFIFDSNDHMFYASMETSSGTLNSKIYKFNGERIFEMWSGNYSVIGLTINVVYGSDAIINANFSLLCASIKDSNNICSILLSDFSENFTTITNTEINNNLSRLFQMGSPANLCAISNVGVLDFDKFNKPSQIAYGSTTTYSMTNCIIDNNYTIWGSTTSNNVLKIYENGTLETVNIPQANKFLFIKNLGFVFVTTENGKLFRSSTTNTFVDFGQTIGSNVMGALVHDSNNNIFIASSDKTLYKVDITNLNSYVVTEFQTNIINSWNHLMIDSSDNIYYITHNGTAFRLNKITPNKIITEIGEIPQSINKIILTENGDFYSLDSAGKIFKTTSSGDYSEVIDLSSLGTVTSMTIDKYNIIYVTSRNGSSNSKITKIKPNNSFVNFANITGNNPMPIECFMDDLGRIYSRNNGLGVRNFTRLETVPKPYIENDNITFYQSGASCQIIDDLNDYSLTTINFNIISGNWNGLNGLALANSSNKNLIVSNSVAVAPKYEIGDKVIWGGYSWINIADDLDGSNNELNLSNNYWNKNSFSENDYKKVFDIIEYDYFNDRISKRYEIDGNNEVVYTVSDEYYMSESSQIKYFQFGNPYLDDKGHSNSKIHNSLYSNINFNGDYTININLKNNSSFKPTWNLFTAISELSIDNSTIESLTFSPNSIIRNVKIYESYLSNLTIPSNKGLSKLIIEADTNIDGNSTNLIESSLIFNNSWLMKIYNRPDGTAKIRYYNNEDALVINDIDDISFD